MGENAGVIHQASRRFSLHHSDDFRALRTIRVGIEGVLAGTPLTNEDRPFIGRKSTVIARCMRALDSRRLRDLVRRGESAAFRKLLEIEIEPDGEEVSCPILGYLSEEQLERLSDVLVEGCAVVDRIQIELNFLDYFDPFALSSLVSGKSLLTHYLRAKHGVLPPPPWAKSLGVDNYWMHTEAAEPDNEMSSIVCESAFLAKRSTSNVRIFGHNQHRVSVDGIELKNHLILAVPTDKTPTNIDAAWREFRAALVEAFIDTLGCYANASSPEFDNSLFMRNYDERQFLISETRQYQSRLYGLWSWDLVHGSGGGGGMTVSESLDRMGSEAEALLKKLAPREMPYDFSTHKNLYDQAVKQIAPKPAKKSTLPKARELDCYLTAHTTILGRRQTAEIG
jgi:hypothetical protein